MVTTAPSSLRAATIFSASSLGTDSFIVLGALSTNFFESTKLRPSMLFTSLMTLGLAAASKDISLRVNSVFSAGAGAASSGSAAAGAAAGAAAAANPPTGRSGMFSRDLTNSVSYSTLCLNECFGDEGIPATFKLDTRSAVSKRVN